MDTRNKRGADIASDHHLLIASVKLKVAAVSNSKKKMQKKFDVEKLKDETTCARFIESLNASVETEHTLTSDWKSIKQTFLKAAEYSIGFKEYKRKSWISDSTWWLINERREIKNQLNSAKTRSAKSALQNTYTKTDKLIKKSARTDKRIWSDNLARKAQEAAETYRTRDLYQTIRQLTNVTLKTFKPLKDENGKLTTAKDEQTTIWERYYEKLLSPTSSEAIQSCGCQRHLQRRDIHTSYPNETEIMTAIRALKNNKTPGPDNINPELLKADPQTTARILFPLLKDIWTSEKIPDELKEGVITLLPKKGNLSECKNWRGITLLSMVNKIIAHIIHKRLSDSLMHGLRKEQAGFRPHCSCVDHINTLRVIVEQSAKWRTPLYLCFIDFEKAFDTLKHDAIWRALVCKGVPEKLINLIKQLYSGACCRVRCGNILSSGIQVRTGVRQGCVLSPLLFNLVLDLAMRQACANNRGISWGLSGSLEDLDYADDICLLSHKYSHISVKLEAVSDIAAQTGLKINIAKTKFMRINTTETPNIQIAGTCLEEVDEFCYLGSIISKNGGSTADIRNRISKGRAAFGMLDKVWRSTHISIRTKLKIFDSSVKSVVLYGCETWNIAANVLQSLQSFLNRCLRKILRIFWPKVISNANLWTVTKQLPIHIEIRRRKWKWIGHTLRKPHDDISRTALDWNPQGSRRRGRPANTWRREVEAEAQRSGYSWREIKFLAINKINYNLFIEAICST
uniref:LINE-1 reverse transcriptase-like protein n=1 Tax=Bactrocera dorsalis TaxID=27457 RepID=A0A034VWX2_BACDO